MARLTEPDEIRMAAGLIRLLIGVLAVTALAAIYPGIAAVRWVYGFYLVAAIVFEVLIILRIGDRPRAALPPRGTSLGRQGQGIAGLRRAHLCH